MRILATIALAAFAGLILAAPASAHVAEGTIALTVAEEVPPPTTAPPANAGGTATIEVNNDLAIEYEVTVHDLTGPALFAHIHEGDAGVPGPVTAFGTLAKIDDSTFRGETAPLTAEQLATLIGGGYYVNVHTGDNGDGEVRGQIVGLEIVHGTCSCRELTKKAFRKCVKQAIRSLEKPERKTPEVKALKKAVKKASCGLTKTPKKKPLACCLPINEAAGAVSGKLCAPVKNDTQCGKLGGTLAAGDVSCVPDNPCTPPASPSGAFLDAGF